MKRRTLVITILLFCIIVVLFFVWKTVDSKQTTSQVRTTPTMSIIPNNISPATSQVKISSGKTPDIPLQLPANFTIHVFASGLGNARDLVFSPGGTLLVSNPANNQVIAMPDKNNDGVADSENVVIDNGNHIHGLAFYGEKLFVAEVNRVVRYTWDEKNLRATFEKVLFSLPDNNDHNNRTITFDNSGNMYVSVGSTCNICLEKSDESATVLISDQNGTNPRIFAKGLRNAAFITMNPQTNELWGTEMGRDYLGDNTPPDEIDSISNGKDYGYPYCYGNRIHDSTLDSNGMHSCDNTELPLYNIPAHSAPLGLTFISSPQFPNDWQHDLLVAYHGSWNRSVPTGFKVVHMKVQGNTITGVDDFLTRFLQSGDSLGRPVDVIFDSLGNLYVSDDKAGNIYIIQKKV